MQFGRRAPLFSVCLAKPVYDRRGGTGDLPPGKFYLHPQSEIVFRQRRRYALSSERLPVSSTVRIRRRGSSHLHLSDRSHTGYYGKFDSIHEPVFTSGHRTVLCMEHRRGRRGLEIPVATGQYAENRREHVQPIRAETAPAGIDIQALFGLHP